jgi:hypothetical protein
MGKENDAIVGGAESASHAGAVRHDRAPVNARPYIIAITPEAWMNISRLPFATFKKFQVAVDAIAADISARPDGEDENTEKRATAEGLVISYKRDDVTRKLTILRLEVAQ